MRIKKKSIYERKDVESVKPVAGSELGIAMNTVGKVPIEGLRHTTQFSLTSSPVGSLPIGSVKELPAGIQVVGKRWYDEKLLEDSMILVSVLKGSQYPPEYTNIDVSAKEYH